MPICRRVTSRRSEQRDGVTAGDFFARDRRRAGQWPRRRGTRARDKLPATAAVMRWRLVRREGDRRDARQHPGLHLQVIVLALPCHFFLMRFEIADALPDFVAL